MASDYPGALDSFTAKTDDVDDVMAVDVNELQEAIVATQTELGTDPAGASATVKARLDALDTTVAAKAAKASNLSDLADAATARTNLGLGSAAVLASSAVAQTANNLSDLASASTARTNLGLGTLATTSPTGTASSSTFLRGDGAWQSPSKYDPRAAIYNAKGSALLRTRSALAACRAATAGAYCDIAVGGTSISGGTGSTRATSWPMYFAQALSDLSGAPLATSTGWVPYAPVGTTTAPNDSRWTITAGASPFNTLTPLGRITSGGTATFTSDVAGTTVSFKHWNNGSASFTYAIDGGSATTVTQTSSTLWSTVTVTGLANTTHTLVLTGVSGTSNIGAAKVDSGASGYGIRVSNFGISGMNFSSWGTPPASYAANSNFQVFGQLIDIQPTLTIIELGTNDSSSSVASLTTSIDSFAAGVQTVGTSDVALVAANPRSGETDLATDGQNKVEQACYAVADSLGIPVLDMYDYFGRLYTPANSAGLMADTIHPSAKGASVFGYGPPLSLIRG